MTFLLCSEMCITCDHAIAIWQKLSRIKLLAGWKWRAEELVFLGGGERGEVLLVAPLHLYVGGHLIKIFIERQLWVGYWGTQSRNFIVVSPGIQKSARHY